MLPYKSLLFVIRGRSGCLTTDNRVADVSQIVTFFGFQSVSTGFLKSISANRLNNGFWLVSIFLSTN